MADLSKYTKTVLSDYAIARSIVDLTINLGQYSHADGKTDGKGLAIGHQRVRDLLPLNELIAAARVQFEDKRENFDPMVEWASKFAMNYMQVIFYAGTGLELDIVLIGMFGDNLAELTERSPMEARWYEQAYRVGVARGLLNASASMVSKAGRGDLPSQRLFLEKKGFLAASNNGVPDAPGGAYTAPPIPIACDVVDALDRAFDERF